MTDNSNTSPHTTGACILQEGNCLQDANENEEIETFRVTCNSDEIFGGQPVKSKSVFRLAIEEPQFGTCEPMMGRAESEMQTKKPQSGSALFQIRMGRSVIETVALENRTNDLQMRITHLQMRANELQMILSDRSEMKNDEHRIAFNKPVRSLESEPKITIQDIDEDNTITMKDSIISAGRHDVNIEGIDFQPNSSLVNESLETDVAKLAVCESTLTSHLDRNATSCREVFGVDDSKFIASSDVNGDNYTNAGSKLAIAALNHVFAAVTESRATMPVNSDGRSTISYNTVTSHDEAICNPEGRAVCRNILPIESNIITNISGPTSVLQQNGLDNEISHSVGTFDSSNKNSSCITSSPLAATTQHYFTQLQLIPSTYIVQQSPSQNCLGIFRDPQSPSQNCLGIFRDSKENISVATVCTDVPETIAVDIIRSSLSASQVIAPTVKPVNSTAGAALSTAGTAPSTAERATSSAGTALSAAGSAPSTAGLALLAAGAAPSTVDSVMSTVGALKSTVGTVKTTNESVRLTTRAVTSTVVTSMSTSVAVETSMADKSTSVAVILTDEAVESTAGTVTSKAGTVTSTPSLSKTSNIVQVNKCNSMTNTSEQQPVVPSISVTRVNMSQTSYSATPWNSAGINTFTPDVSQCMTWSSCGQNNSNSRLSNRSLAPLHWHTMLPSSTRLTTYPGMWVPMGALPHSAISRYDSAQAVVYSASWNQRSDSNQPSQVAPHSEMQQILAADCPSRESTIYIDHTGITKLETVSMSNAIQSENQSHNASPCTLSCCHSQQNSQEISVNAREKGCPKYSTEQQYNRGTPVNAKKRGRSRKPTRDEQQNNQGTPVNGKKRGRPRKPTQDEHQNNQGTPVHAKKRGRQRKSIQTKQQNNHETPANAKKRGRPRKAVQTTPGNGSGKLLEGKEQHISKIPVNVQQQNLLKSLLNTEQNKCSISHSEVERQIQLENVQQQSLLHTVTGQQPDIPSTPVNIQQQSELGKTSSAHQKNISTNSEKNAKASMKSHIIQAKYPIASVNATSQRNDQSSTNTCIGDLNNVNMKITFSEINPNPQESTNKKIPKICVDDTNVIVLDTSPPMVDLCVCDGHEDDPDVMEIKEEVDVFCVSSGGNYEDELVYVGDGMYAYSGGEVCDGSNDLSKDYSASNTASDTVKHKSDVVCTSDNTASTTSSRFCSREAEPHIMDSGTATDLIKTEQIYISSDKETGYSSDVSACEHGHCKIGGAVTDGWTKKENICITAQQDFTGGMHDYDQGANEMCPISTDDSGEIYSVSDLDLKTNQRSNYEEADMFEVCSEPDEAIIQATPISLQPLTMTSNPACPRGQCVVIESDSESITSSDEMMAVEVSQCETLKAPQQQIMKLNSRKFDSSQNLKSGQQKTVNQQLQNDKSKKACQSLSSMSPGVIQIHHPKSKQGQILNLPNSVLHGKLGMPNLIRVTKSSGLDQLDKQRFTGPNNLATRAPCHCVAPLRASQLQDVLSPPLTSISLLSPVNSPPLIEPAVIAKPTLSLDKSNASILRWNAGNTRKMQQSMNLKTLASTVKPSFITSNPGSVSKAELSMEFTRTTSRYPNNSNPFLKTKPGCTEQKAICSDGNETESPTEIGHQSTVKPAVISNIRSPNKLLQEQDYFKIPEFCGVTGRPAISSVIPPNQSRAKQQVAEQPKKSEQKVPVSSVLWQQHLFNIGMDPDEQKTPLHANFFDLCCTPFTYDVEAIKSPNFCAEPKVIASHVAKPKCQMNFHKSRIVITEESKSQAQHSTTPQAITYTATQSIFTKDPVLSIDTTPKHTCCVTSSPLISTECMCGGRESPLQVANNQLLSSEKQEVDPKDMQLEFLETDSKCKYCHSSDPSKSGMGLICPLCGECVQPTSDQEDTEATLDIDEGPEAEKDAALPECHVEIRELQQVPDYKIIGCRVRHKIKDPTDVSSEVQAWNKALANKQGNAASRGTTPWKLPNDSDLTKKQLLKARKIKKTVSSFEIDSGDIKEICQSQNDTILKGIPRNKSVNITASKSDEQKINALDNQKFDSVLARSSIGKRKKSVQVHNPFVVSNDSTVRKPDTSIQSRQLSSPMMSLVRKRGRPSMHKEKKIVTNILSTQDRGRPHEAKCAVPSSRGSGLAEKLVIEEKTQNKKRDKIKHNTKEQAKAVKSENGKTEIGSESKRNVDRISCLIKQYNNDAVDQCLMDTTIDLLSQSGDSMLSQEELDVVKSKGHISIQSSDSMDRSYEIIGEEYPSRREDESEMEKQHREYINNSKFDITKMSGSKLVARHRTTANIDTLNILQKQCKSVDATILPLLRPMTVALKRINVQNPKKIVRNYETNVDMMRDITGMESNNRSSTWCLACNRDFHNLEILQNHIRHSHDCAQRMRGLSLSLESTSDIVWMKLADKSCREIHKCENTSPFQYSNMPESPSGYNTRARSLRSSMKNNCLQDDYGLTCSKANDYNQGMIVRDSSNCDKVIKDQNLSKEGRDDENMAEYDLHAKQSDRSQFYDYQSTGENVQENKRLHKDRNAKTGKHKRAAPAKKSPDVGKKCKHSTKLNNKKSPSHTGGKIMTKNDSTKSPSHKKKTREGLKKDRLLTITSSKLVEFSVRSDNSPTSQDFNRQVAVTYSKTGKKQPKTSAKKKKLVGKQPTPDKFSTCKFVQCQKREVNESSPGDQPRAKKCKMNTLATDPERSECTQISSKCKDTVAKSGKNEPFKDDEDFILELHMPCDTELNDFLSIDPDLKIDSDSLSSCVKGSSPVSDVGSKSTIDCDSEKEDLGKTPEEIKSSFPTLSDTSSDEEEIMENSSKSQNCTSDIFEAIQILRKTNKMADTVMDHGFSDKQNSRTGNAHNLQDKTNVIKACPESKSKTVNDGNNLSMCQNRTTGKAKSISNTISCAQKQPAKLHVGINAKGKTLARKPSNDMPCSVQRKNKNTQHAMGLPAESKTGTTKLISAPKRSAKQVEMMDTGHGVSDGPGRQGTWKAAWQRKRLNYYDWDDPKNNDDEDARRVADVAKAISAIPNVPNVSFRTVPGEKTTFKHLSKLPKTEISASETESHTGDGEATEAVKPKNPPNFTCDLCEKSYNTRAKLVYHKESSKQHRRMLRVQKLAITRYKQKLSKDTNNNVDPHKNDISNHTVGSSTDGCSPPPVPWQQYPHPMYYGYPAWGPTPHRTSYNQPDPSMANMNSQWENRMSEMYHYGPYNAVPSPYNAAADPWQQNYSLSAPVVSTTQTSAQNIVSSMDSQGNIQESEPTKTEMSNFGGAVLGDRCDNMPLDFMSMLNTPNALSFDALHLDLPDELLDYNATGLTSGGTLQQSVDGGMVLPSKGSAWTCTVTSGTGTPITSLAKDTEASPSTQWYNLVTQTMHPVEDEQSSSSHNYQQKQFTDLSGDQANNNGPKSWNIYMCDGRVSHVPPDTNSQPDDQSQNAASKKTKNHSTVEQFSQFINDLGFGDTTDTNIVSQSWPSQCNIVTNDCQFKDTLNDCTSIAPVTGFGDILPSNPVSEDINIPVTKTSLDIPIMSGLNSLDALAALNLACRTETLSIE